MPNPSDPLQIEAMHVAREQVRFWAENGVNKTRAMMSLGLYYSDQTWHDITCLVAAMWLELEGIGV